MKIVVNGCYGGFSLSRKAMKLLGVDDESVFDYYHDVKKRTDKKLVSVVEQLGDEASGANSCLMVVEFPDNATDYRIVDYDGIEDVYYVVNGKIGIA